MIQRNILISYQVCCKFTFEKNDKCFNDVAFNVTIKFYVVILNHLTLHAQQHWILNIWNHQEQFIVCLGAVYEEWS